MSMAPLDNIVHLDEDLVVIDKPPGYHVHPPENSGGFPIPRNKILLHRVRDHFKKYIYPVHRLDVATSGLLIFAFNKESASILSQNWQEAVQKKYWVVARGFLPELRMDVNLPLLSDSSKFMVECQTRLQVLSQVEIPYSVNSRFSTSRYSWLEASLKTGRFHQIRRHLNHISHPVVGDSMHGDSHHNRFFREQLKIPGLCLRAQSLDFQHPKSGKMIHLVAPETEKWNRISLLFSSFDQVFQKQ